MADTYTSIADIVVPEIFDPLVVEESTEKTALWTSGIVAGVEDLGQFARKGGTQIQMPFWNDLTGDDEVLEEDVALTVNKINTGVDSCVLHGRGKAWGSNELAQVLNVNRADPMKAIASLVGGWWTRRYQVILLKTLEGIFDAASMATNVHDISGEAGDLAVIGAETFLDAQQKLGDAKEKLTAIAMHSATETKLKKLNLIDYVPDSEQAGKMIATYGGKRVLVDDTMPVTSGVYTTYLFGAGAIGWADGGAPTPSETDRNILKGQDVLANRRLFVLHPRGVRWKAAPMNRGPRNTELADGDNWERVYHQKHIRIVKFVHKIA